MLRTRQLFSLASRVEITTLPRFFSEQSGGSFEKGPASHRIFVGNLPFTANWQNLKSFMESSVGEVRFCTIFKDKATGNSKGCGIVEFNDEETATNAINNLNNTVFPGTNRAVFVRPDQGHIKSQ